MFAEGQYIVRARFGSYQLGDVVGAFTPVLAMFVIRRAIFSYIFLAIYIAISVQMFFEARAFHLGLYEFHRWVPSSNPVIFMGMFFVLSVYVLALYLCGCAVWFVVTSLWSKRS
jgi:hypothetical protein